MSSIDFTAGEQLIGVFGRSGKYIDQIGFVSVSPDNVLRSCGPYGGSGGAPFFIFGQIDGFFGRCGDYVDAIGAYLEPGGTAWS